MRIKAVPDDSIIDKGGKAIGGLFKEKWVLYGGIGLGALAVFLYLQNSNANAGQASTGIVPGLPVSYGVSAGTSTPVTNGSGQDNTALLAAIQAQTANDQATQQANLAAIAAQAQAAIAADQTNLDLGAIAGQVSNYANSTNTLESFISAAKVGGSPVLGVTGAVTPTGFGGANVDLYASNEKTISAIPFLTGTGGSILHPGPSKYGSKTPGTVNPVLTGTPSVPPVG